MKEFCDLVNSRSVCFLTDHLQQVFVTLYIECSKYKERHMQLQIKWHQHCSYFLVDKNMHRTVFNWSLPFQPSCESEMDIRSKWNKVCTVYCLHMSNAEKFLI